MNMLDMQMAAGVTSAPVSSDKEDQASHAAAPTAYGFKTNALTITITIAAFYIIIYLLHAAERVIRQ